ncbi:MAG: LamG-like jellyroll fold domain-containing protein, partial [Pirellulales bacterium]
MRIKSYTVLAIFSFLLFSVSLHVNAQEKQVHNIYAKDNLVAWCIVPFDGKKRGPADRAAMCAKLGLKKIAYDWRNEHVPTFEQEIIEYKKHGLEFFAFWSVHEDAFRLFEKYDLHPQIWVTLSSPKEKTQTEKVKAAAVQLLPLVERTRKMGCQLGLYNHGGWGGEPENMVAVCNYLRQHHDGNHVGIVYNQHHAHSRIDDFSEVIALTKPFLLCLNLNGMNRNGDTQGEKILPLGEGQFDVALLKTIRDSGYNGPIGIIGHTQDDVEQRLQDNLDGLEWILPQLDGQPAGPKPTPRTWSPKKTLEAATNHNRLGSLLAGKEEYRTPPISVECRAVLNQREDYNILVASDTKKSGTHWELFSMAGSGVLTAYTPGLTPDHTRSTANICDGKPHNLAMVYEPNRLRLFVDGKLVADQPVKSNNQESVPGDLGIGRLVDGPFRLRGEVEWLRISNNARSSAWSKTVAPPTDDSTVLNWTPSTEEICTPENTASEQTGLANNLNQPFEYSPDLVTTLIEEAKLYGDAGRGLMVFAAAKSACLSCHKIGMHGGKVGPDLTKIGTQRKPQQIIESVLWPKRHVLPEYTAYSIATEDGRTHSGYIIKEDSKQLVLHDPTQGSVHRTTILVEDIELRRKTGSLMPDNLTSAMSKQQKLDLLQCLVDLGRPASMSLADINSTLHHAHAHLQGAASFPFDNKPIHPEDWPNSQHHVNRDRLYDFYTKEADYFQGVAASGKVVPAMLQGFPGLDGGTLGHWGNQNETVWASDAWNDVQLGSMQSGVFRGDGVTVPRGVCVQLGEQSEMACCFNPATLSYDAIWKDGFLKFSSVRHGFMHGVTLDGTALHP